MDVLSQLVLLCLVSLQLRLELWVGKSNPVSFLGMLHDKQRSDLNVLDYLGRQVVSVVRYFWDDLAQKTLVVFSNHLTKLFFDVNSAGIANLESIGADLEHGKRNDFDLLKATVNHYSCVEARCIERHGIREHAEDALDLELFEHHPAQQLNQLPLSSESLTQDDLLVLWVDFEHVVEDEGEELLDLVPQSLIVEPKGGSEAIRVEFGQVLPD